jgi:hypothetical protein
MTLGEYGIDIKFSVGTITGILVELGSSGQ